LNINGLQRKKYPKTEKNTEKMSFLLRGPLVFLPKGVILGSILTVKLFCGLQVVVHEELLQAYKMAIF
jgi:hypothetical protein